MAYVVRSARTLYVRTLADEFRDRASRGRPLRRAFRLWKVLVRPFVCSRVRGY
jgi:hypothetical protein